MAFNSHGPPQTIGSRFFSPAPVPSLTLPSNQIHLIRSAQAIDHVTSCLRSSPSSQSCVAVVASLRPRSTLQLELAAHTGRIADGFVKRVMVVGRQVEKTALSDHVHAGAKVPRCQAGASFSLLLYNVNVNMARMGRAGRAHSYQTASHQMACHYFKP